MRVMRTTLAAAALAAAVSLAPSNEAKADGGAVVVGVGAYLLVDYVVGRKCHMHHWPFNLVKKIAYGIHGRPVCHYRKRYYKY